MVANRPLDSVSWIHVCYVQVETLYKIGCTGYNLYIISLSKNPNLFIVVVHARLNVNFT